MWIQWLADLLYILRRLRARRRVWLYIGVAVHPLTGDEEY